MKTYHHPCKERVGLAVELMAQSTKSSIKERFRGAFDNYLLVLETHEFRTDEEKEIFEELYDSYKNVDQYTDEEISDVVRYKLIRLSHLTQISE